MSCSRFEADIALYAGGDLPASRMARVELVEGHVAECADCRALLDDLRAGHALLGELRGEPLEEAMLAQVRQRVLAEVRSADARRRGSLAPLLALAAAVILAVVLLWPRHPAKPASMARAEPARVTPAAPAPKIVPARHRVVRERSRRPAAPPGPPLLVQLVTDDPNIVIYWLIDQKPQGD